MKPTSVGANSDPYNRRSLISHVRKTTGIQSLTYGGSHQEKAIANNCHVGLMCECLTNTSDPTTKELALTLSEMSYSHSSMNTPTVVILIALAENLACIQISKRQTILPPALYDHNIE